jgi:hypothetical protein
MKSAAAAVALFLCLPKRPRGPRFAQLGFARNRQRRQMPRLVPPHSRSRNPPDRTDYARRDFINLAATATLLVVALLIAWTFKAFTESEARQRCFDSGRKDCAPIAAPPRGLAIPAR